MTESPRRLLILSDLHLGRDCKAITGFERSVRPDPGFDVAFIDMLSLYTEGCESDWRLIFAGDFIDFVEVVLVPDEKGPANLLLSFEPSKEERSYGLGTEAERALVKLEMTLDYHRAFFQAVARFVRRGGELVIMRGNHDAEMHWRKVQRVLRRRLAEYAFRGTDFDLDELLEERGSFQSRIEFSPWCYVEPGRVYVEHGHQYDAYCSFDHQLYPVSPSDPKRIDTPLFMFAMRYFVNMMADFLPESVQKWRLRDYWQWLREKGPSGVLYTLRMAAGAVGRAVIYAVQFAYGRVGRYTREHAKRLAEEAERYRVPVEKLREVDGLHDTPITRNLSELMRLLFLDRALIVLASLLLTLLVLVVFEDVWFELAGIFLVAFTAYRINQKLAPRRFLVPGPKEARAAAEIAAILDVPLVVMGHSHVRRLSDLGEGRMYVNTGCWLPPPPERDHTDPSAPCTCKLSHLVVEETRPELRVFCKATKTVREADVQVTPPRSPDTEPEDDPFDATVTLVPGMASDVRSRWSGKR
jgi:UDP-2,3-diacylglucosamine pyrophosphatase LpxH